ncbi:hypothetical protein [Pinirhizobacter soli]|uniref:hypothetical protein n=1 Tax=Pinirhizobacter soli TaxID=2786953 RepID=UPI002029BA77|nr:hypothetical protein [Pinirhizobacter soli]
MKWRFAVLLMAPVLAHAQSDAAFDWSSSDDPKTIEHFRYCGKTLDSTPPR